MTMLEIIFLVLSISFFVSYVVTLRKLTIIKESASQLVMISQVYKDLLDAKNPTSDEDLHKENFIKFLSDSRDWAFDYIDKVQKGLKEFIKIADKEFAYFDSYGILSQGYPHYETMEKISAEYKKLKELLPEETDDRR